MKLNKNIFIFALLLMLLFFCISSVSAYNSLNTTSQIQSLASDGSNDILRDLGTTIYVDSSYSGENENGSADAPYKKISSAVSSANGGENIFIKNGEYSESSKISPAVSMNFVGESQDGVIINSTSTNSLFEMTENGIVLSFNNLTFKDIAFNINAPIKIGGNSDVNINNCSFINCSSKLGSIHLYTKATATVSNCKIENSKCTKSGGCGALYISAGTFNIKNTLINNSRFKVNSGFMYGVIYSYDSNAIVNLDNVTISNSKGAASGVIYNKGTINVKNSKIISNTVEKSSTGLQGESVIYTHNGAKTTIEQSVIADNVAPNNFIYNIGATSNTVLNYNAIYNNTFGSDFASSNGITNLDYNWWGSNSQPTGVTVNNWVIVDENNHQMLNDGSPLDKELPIPTLNNPEPNDDAIYVSMSGNDNNNGSRDAPVATIAKAIEIANTGKIIILNGQYIITNTLKVNKTLSIEGKGNVVIDGNSLRILENTANLNLTNIKFTNAKSAFASAILNEGNMTIDTCSFYSNKATGTSNGNIINNKANLTINNCDFYENIASRGAIASQSKSKLLINNSKFHNNDMTSITTTYGIIYSNSADVVVVNTNFTDNKAKIGGAIYVTRASSSTTGTLNVLNCIFKNNIANIGNGGAIFTARTLTNIENTTFINNTAIKSFNNVGGNGGAIYQSINDLTNIVTIKNSIFIGNAASNGAAFYVNAGKLNVSNSIILNKENDNTYALNKSNEVNNNAITANDNWWGSNSKANTLIPVERWVMMDASYSPSNAQPGDEITIEASFTKYNSTSGTGDLEGIIPDGIIVKFKTNTMGLNKNATTKNGKAIVTYTLKNEDNNIYVSSSNANVTLPIVLEILDIIYVSPSGNDSNNGARETPVASLAHAIEIAERGQIVLLEGTHSASGLSISNTLNITGEGNVIIDVGANGRLAYIHTGGVLTLNNLTLINGYLSSESGALLGNAGNLTLINTTLSNSTSTNNGGAIYNVGNLKIINSIIANNKAELGGAIFADAFAGRGSLVIINTTFTNNTAKGNNRDKAGGAIYAQAFKGKFDILNSTFIANTAGSYGGGAIFGLQLGDVSIKNSTFVNNAAKSTENYGGGAICFIGGNYQKEGSLTIKNTLFDNNKANVSGAAIYVRGSTLTISNSVLLNNIDNNGIAIHKGVTSYVSAVVNANDNWWGTNKNPSRFVSSGSNLNRWVILTATNNTAITEGNTVRLTVSLNTYTTGTANGTLDSPIIISRPVVINTTSGVINGILENGEFSTDYIVPSGLKIITATVDDETQVIYVKVVKTELTINNITAKKGERVDFIANVVANDGEIINRGHVDLYINNELFKVISVSNGKAIERILISNDVGVYDILAKYIDETGGFEKSNASAILNVTGINNFVTNSTFFNFFDSGGVLLSDVPFNDLIFLGDFSGLGVNIVDLNRNISILGSNAVLYDMGFLISASGVVLNSLTSTQIGRASCRERV